MANAIVPNMNEIVRPFVIAPTPAASSNPRTDASATDNPPLVITAEINSSVDAARMPSLGVQTTWNEDKSQRVTEKVKVENPDDKTQYVEVERLKECTMIDVETGKKYKMRFADWDSGRKGDFGG